MRLRKLLAESYLKTLSQAEQRYSNIEREALAIVCGKTLEVFTWPEIQPQN